MSKSGIAGVQGVDLLEKGNEARDKGGFACFFLAVVLSAVLALVVFWKMVPVAGAADASGYMNFARLLSDGTMTESLRRPEGAVYEEMPKALFQPLGFTYRPESERLSPTYPMGLPLLLALGNVRESEVAVRAVYAAVSFLACMGIWFLGTELGLRRAWRFYAVAMLATSPLFLWSSLILMSDALATCQATWVVFFALVAKRSRSAALACGFLLGWAVLTRPSNVLLFVPVIAALAQERASGGKWLCVMWGGLPALALFLWGNGTLYGDPLGHGYGGLWSFFAWEYVLATSIHYVRILAFALFFLVLPTAILGAFRMRLGSVRLLLAWSVPVFAFYAFYFFTSQTWWFLRFVLVAIPGIVLLSAVCLERGVARFDRLRRKENGLALVWAVLSLVMCAYWEGRLNIFGEQAFERRYVEECAWANTSLSSGTLVVCMQASGAFYYYTDFPVFRWDLAKMDSDWERLRQAVRESETEVIAVLHAFETLREDSILTRYPEHWELMGEVAERVTAYRMR